MRQIAQFMMLASLFAIAFINPAFMGRGLYFSLFPFMVFWVWVFYRSSYVVTEKDVRAVREGDFSYSCFCGMVPQVGSGDLSRGRLVVTKEGLELYRKIRKRGREGAKCELSWHLDAKDIQSLEVGKVLSFLPGVVFSLDEGDVRFVHWGAGKEKERMVEALGWKSVPQKPLSVRVGEEAASAPSFSEVNKSEGVDS